MNGKLYKTLTRLVILALCASMIVAVQSVSANTVTVVTPASSTWGFISDNGTTGDYTTGFEVGPDGAPLGEGSAFITLGSAAAGITLATQNYQGTRLADIEALSYSTYTTLPVAAMTFQINYDIDLDDTNTPWYGRLVYEPYMNGTVESDTWQTWDMLAGGNAKWWASNNANSPVDNVCGQSSPCTLTDLLQQWPDLRIRNDASSAIQFKAGSNWNGFEGNVDNLNVTIGGVLDTYDFEPLTTFYVDDSWSGVSTGSDPDADGPAQSFGADSFATIQAAIDAAGAGATIYVYPGNYNETAANRTVLAGTPAQSGPYTFGLFLPIDKPGLSLIGVDEEGLRIEDPMGEDQPYITTNATNNFGTSGIWVEGANIIVQGFEFGPNIPGDNKTFEIVANGFTLQYSNFSIPYGGAVYFGDWLYDPETEISAIEGYVITENVFDDGTLISINNGAGDSGSVEDRIISNNVFAMAGANDPDPTNWPAISFTGSGTDVPWFVHPVGGALIFENEFSGSTQYIRSRGTVDETSFDWWSYWNDNFYDKKVMAGPFPPDEPRAFAYMSGSYNMPNTMRIGAVIADELAIAEPGDTVLIGAGTYVQSATLDLNKLDVTLLGEDDPVIQISGGSDAFNITAEGVTLDGLTIQKTDKTSQAIIRIAASNTSIQNNEISGQFVIGDPEASRAMVFNAGAFTGLNISDNTIYDVRQPAYISGTHEGTISNNHVYRTKGWVLEGGDLTFTGNTWGTGADANVYDIAILGTMPAAYYTDIVAMSADNDGAVIEDQRVSPAVLSHVYVDVATAFTSDLGGRYHPYSSIAAAIARVVPGGTIHVANGTYTEQVTINKSLHLVGEGAETIIKAPATLPASGNQTSAIVIVDGSGVDAELTGFTVSGPGPTGCGSIAAGIFVRGGANADIHHNTIQDIRDSTFSGCQNGVAILVGRLSWATSGTATIANNSILGYQKGGIVVSNTGSSATITNNVVTGVGTTPVIAQNGIQISSAATATLSNNTVTGNSFHLAGNAWDWASAGVLLIDSGDVALTGGNRITGNDQNLYNSGAASLTLAAETIGSSTAPVDYGYNIIQYASNALDATSVDFDGLTDNFAIEDRIWHVIDEAGLGLVTWEPNNVYITPASQVYQPGAIQRGINAVATGGTVNVAAGTYNESPSITKSLTLQSAAGRDATTINLQNGTNYLGALSISGAGNNVTVDGFTIVGFDAPDTDSTDLASTNIFLGTGLGHITLNHNRIKVGNFGPESNGDDGFGLITTYNVNPAEDIANLEVLNTIFEPVNTAAGRAFYVNPGVNVFHFENNQINGNFARTAITQARNGSVAHNMLTGSGSSAGMGTWGFPDAIVYGHTTFDSNTVSGTANAISIFDTNGVSVLNNILDNNGIGIRTVDYGTAGLNASTITLTGNQLLNNTSFDVSNGYPTGTINAERNWWGSASPVWASSVSGNVDYSPWCGDSTCSFMVQGPPSFNKANPGDGAANRPANVAIYWYNSLGATSYEYCYDTTNDGQCSSWVNTGLVRNATITGLTPSTTYYWQARANNQYGSTYANAGTYWSFTTASLPAGFSKSSPLDGVTIAGDAVLTWAASSGAVSYDYCYDTSNDGQCSNWVNTGTTRSVTLGGLNPSMTYYWQVRANNSMGSTFANGSESGFWSFTPSQLAGFNKANPGNGSIGRPTTLTLYWYYSAGATSYEYCYDLSNDGLCSTWVSTGLTRNVTLSGLEPNRTYYWQVRSNNGYGSVYANGAESAYWSFTTGSLPGSFTKSTPASGVAVTSDPVLTWGASGGATSYEYCYDTTDDGQCNSWVSTGMVRSVTLTGLTPSTTYYWQVRANNNIGTSYSNGGYWSFTTSQPGGFNKANPGNGAINRPTSLTLYWYGSSGATSYEYCYDTTDDGQCSNWVSTGLVRNVTLSGLDLNTTYYWQVRAVNVFGMTYANANTFWSFTTKP